MSAPISIVLRAPPSLNHLFANKKTGGRFATEAYEAWRVEAGWLIKQARLKPIKGQVKITLAVEDRGRRDLSNAGLKSIEDLLVTHGLIEGDDRRYVRGITLGWSEEVKGVAVLVEGVA
jgi:Holliday junction resolvase RusA-like endonuclease